MQIDSAMVELAEPSADQREGVSSDSYRGYELDPTGWSGWPKKSGPRLAEMFINAQSEKVTSCRTTIWRRLVSYMSVLDISEFRRLVQQSSEGSKK